MQADSIAFSPSELRVLCGMLALPSPWEAGDAHSDASLAEATAQLRQRGAVHSSEDEVAIPVAELLRHTARPVVDIDLRFAGPRRPGNPRRIRMRGDGLAMVETVSDETSMRFTPFGSADLLRRLAERCGLDVRPRPSGPGFTASLSVLDACKDAAEADGAAAAAAALRDGGVAAADADAFAAALTSIEQTVAVRLTIRVGRIREGIELFWLDAPGGRWALPSILSPFASSAADVAASSDSGPGPWTVDPITTMLTVSPTDASELLAAVHAALSSGTTSTASSSS